VSPRPDLDWRRLRTGGEGLGELDSLRGELEGAGTAFGTSVLRIAHSLCKPRQSRAAGVDNGCCNHHFCWLWRNF